MNDTERLEEPRTSTVQPPNEPSPLGDTLQERVDNWTKSRSNDNGA